MKRIRFFFLPDYILHSIEGKVSLDEATIARLKEILPEVNISKNAETTFDNIINYKKF